MRHVHRNLRLCALADAATGLPPAAATAAITLTAPGTVFASAPCSLGFAFLVNAPLDLVGLAPTPCRTRPASGTGSISAFSRRRLISA